jgi:hypothetical protein
MNIPSKDLLKSIFIYTVYVFSAIGFFLTAGYFAITLGFTNTKGIIDIQTKTFLDKSYTKDEYALFPLSHTKEWIAFRIAVAKDKPMIDQISKETGIPSRLLVAVLVPEQMRLFYTDRPVFKAFFEPLKILGSQSQFSWGIFGIKESTALEVESHLRNTHSPFYLGKQYEGQLIFTDESTGTSSERFTRITDQYDHKYAYLYAALYLAQIEKQWDDRGYPLKERPDILATLWNLGFTKSKPNSTPQSGGAEIAINGSKYSFGSLASTFYYSDEMIELFPR